MDRHVDQRLPPLPLVLYDGECALCDAVVRWLLVHDRDRKLLFAPLQGTTAASLRAHGVPLPPALDTVVLVRDRGCGPEVLLRSRALLGIYECLGFWPWHARLLACAPRWIADAAYRLVAATRYRIFGRRAACELPPPSEQSRFLP